MFRILLLITALFANSASAETAEESRAFACVAVGGMLYFSDSPDHAIVGPGRLTAADTKDGGIQIRNEVEVLGEFARSGEQDDQSVVELMKACRAKLNVRLSRSPKLMRAFNGTGLSCDKAGEAVTMSDGSGQEIDFSAVTMWSKTTSTTLTVMTAGGDFDLTLSPLQEGLSATELVVGCWQEADVIRRPILAKTG